MSPEIATTKMMVDCLTLNVCHTDSQGAMLRIERIIMHSCGGATLPIDKLFDVIGHIQQDMKRCCRHYRFIGDINLMTTRNLHRTLKEVISITYYETECDFRFGIGKRTTTDIRLGNNHIIIGAPTQYLRILKTNIEYVLISHPRFTRHFSNIYYLTISTPTI